jgi:hypothetical protein
MNTEQQTAQNKQHRYTQVENITIQVSKPCVKYTEM